MSRSPSTPTARTWRCGITRPRKDAPPADGAAAPDADETPQGATLIVRDLATLRDTTLGNVAEFAWQDKGRLLAVTISAEDKAGNGVQLFDPESSALACPRLVLVRLQRARLAEGRGRSGRPEIEERRSPRRPDPRRAGVDAPPEPSEAARTYDPTADHAFPPGMRTVAFRRPSWSDDGAVVFLGVAKWTEKPAAPKKAAATADWRQRSRRRETGGGRTRTSRPAVDVWHSRDVDVMPKQKISATRDRQRNLLAAWHLEARTLVPLGHDLYEQVTPLKQQNLAYAVNWTAYAMDRSSAGRRRTSIWSISIAASGRRSWIASATIASSASPGRKYLLYLQDDQYWTVEHRHARRGQHHEVRADVVRRSRIGLDRSNSSPRSASPAGPGTTRR